MRMLLLGLAIILILNSIALNVYAQNETNETTEPTITIENIKVYRFNQTTINFGFYNQTHLIVSYMCIYDNTTDDCCKLQVEMYDENMTLQATYNFTNMTDMCNLEGICSKAEFFPIGLNHNITFKIYKIINETNKTLLQEGVIYIPVPGVPMTGYMGILATLIPIAILIKLAGRGNIRDIGLGMFLFGITLLLIGYLGIYPEYSYVAFVISILIGLILVYFSES